MKKLGLLFIAAIMMSAAHAADLAKVSEAWVRQPPPGARIVGAFMTIETNTPLTLASAESPAADVVEIHTMSMHNGVMEMRQLTEGIALTPGKPVKLQPGGLHLMLIDLKKPLKEGDKVPFTLTFKDGKRTVGTVEVQAVVKRP